MESEAAGQAAGEGEAGRAAGAAGPAAGTRDQGGSGDPTSHGLLTDQEVQYGPRGPTSPGGPDTQNDPYSPPGQYGPDAPGNQGAVSSLGGAGEEETMGAAAIDVPSGAQAADVSGPVSTAAGAGTRLKVFKVSVPFRCSLEAEMARITMDEEEEQNPQQAIQREIKIKGSVLSVKWAAEDFDLLRVAVNAFLEKLSVVMQNIQSIWPFMPRRGSRGRRAGIYPSGPN